MRRATFWTLVVVGAVVGPMLGLAAGPAIAAAPTGPHGVYLTVDSLNWAGYAVTGASGSVTQVTGSWTQPTVTCTRSATTYAAFWDGIDGYNSNTVEQGGTLAYCSRGTASYYAWYEFYPAASVEITSISVHPGNTIAVTVTYSSSTSSFSIQVQDGTQSYTHTGTVSGAERTSAECIAERPEVNGRLASLADFGTANFGEDHTSSIGCGATISGTTGTFGSFSTATAINMVDSSSRTLASTGALSTDGSSFTETWVASS
jgi:hypothetical protein